MNRKWESAYSTQTNQFSSHCNKLHNWTQPALDLRLVERRSQEDLYSLHHDDQEERKGGHDSVFVEEFNSELEMDSKIRTTVRTVKIPAAISDCKLKSSLVPVYS